VGWNHRRAVPLIVGLLGLGLVLGACSGTPASTDSSAASWNDQPLASSAAPLPESASAAVPSPSVSASASPSGKATVKSAPKPATYTFPVIGKNSYGHSHHDYPATDIITNCGNKVVAVTSGTILTSTRKDTWKASVNAGATRGGLSVSLLGDDGVRYYGSHLSSIAAGINPGVRVSVGQSIGKTGDTGDASACHLHFGISPPCAKVGDWWTQRGVIYPWPYFDAWRKHQNKSAVAAVAAWKSKHGCPKKPLTDP
jgi:murein DD-endopeptidase MepM/ murein hydrolase activator NlpD